MDSDSDSDDGSSDAVPVWAGRAGTISISSMDDEARIIALEAARAELDRQLRDSHDTLSRRVAAHEAELEELNTKLEDARAELSAVRREEKELRAKERGAATSLAGLEAEVARLQKALDSSRANYTQLNKQYQEQCGEQRPS
jgi:chromosome segregation ATPase